MWNIPNLLTLFRMLMIPAIIYAFYSPSVASYWTALFFSVAAVTDWLDGFLARKLNQSTPFGALIDPLADKLMVSTTLVLLVSQHATIWLTIPAAIIIMREITVSGLREWMAQIGLRDKVKVSSMGKLKTTVQMLGILLLLIVQPAFDNEAIVFDGAMIICYLLIYVAALLTLWSLLNYLKAAWPYLK
ncbi:MAG: CDP-diacylglycerol--glycerol-3-phosphate 3-phosphatidyltransferase [Pseudomonadota bacterium]|nr:CDP-diacylglycerol--glycerol-3-phosphate 3-phosphatidyltransferase [Pseudomonadota bacterium]